MTLTSFSSDHLSPTSLMIPPSIENTVFQPGTIRAIGRAKSIAARTASISVKLTYLKPCGPLQESRHEHLDFQFFTVQSHYFFLKAKCTASSTLSFLSQGLRFSIVCTIFEAPRNKPKFISSYAGFFLHTFTETDIYFRKRKINLQWLVHSPSWCFPSHLIDSTKRITIKSLNSILKR